MWIWLSRVRTPSSTLLFLMGGKGALSSMDRASDFESAGCRFESCRAQFQNGPLAQLVEQQTLNLWVKGSIPLRLKCYFCGGSVVVTHHLAKVGHAGPIPVRRLFFSLLCSVYISVAPSPLWFCHKLMEFYISLESNRSNI